jgi:hypothetical protein
MKAGRELDALIADKVMGWEKCNESYLYFDGVIFRTLELTSYGKFEPSTDIADAWLVVEKLRDKNLEIHLESQYNSFGERVYFCEFSNILVAKEAETAPLAICLAALKACGVEV